MRKVFLFILLVIVLVSLSWFKDLLAQDLSKVSDEQKKELLRLYKSKNATVPESKDTYSTPEIFDDSLAAPDNPVMAGQAPIDALSKHRDNEKEKVISRGLKAELPTFEELKPFGYDLFENASENSSSVDIATTADYVLGPGDNILVYLWGRVEKEYNLTLDREGKVFVPQVGEIVGWSLSLEKFQERAIRQFSRVYSDFDLTISLGKIRSIRIYVTGEVKRPGAYTVSSLTSLFNAIYTAGGPNERGSMRSIKLMRAGKEAAIVDLYKFLLEGDNAFDARLESGDLIFVPVAGTMVAIRGEVKRPAWYEISNNETALTLLHLAGDQTAEAHLDRVMLERVSGKAEWEVLDLNLNQSATSSSGDMALKDGDRVTVYSIFDFKRNMVSIAGQVKHAGCYERNDSTKVADLLNRGQLQAYDVYYD
ncbi:MAG: polysaccharide biosynthesis/export family protein, partial [Candidatus Zixiibacteriota bacterium]